MKNKLYYPMRKESLSLPTEKHVSAGITTPKKLQLKLVKLFIYLLNYLFHIYFSLPFSPLWKFLKVLPFYGTENSRKLMAEIYAILKKKKGVGWGEDILQLN